jgi:hypothetical protein
MDDLRQVIRTCPVIDSHGHNLLRPHGLRSSDFLTITSEATGEALHETPKTLAHLRAAKQLRKLYDLPIEADWNAIQQERSRILYEDPDGLTRKCLQRTQTILIDDGLGSPGDFEPYQWHSQFTHSPCKRIVRIEAVAASILASLHQQWKLPVGISIADDEACSLAWVKFITAFEQAIAQAIEDDEVVGFKSVICYRAGLGVKIGRDIEVTEAGLKSFMEEFLPTCESRAFRVESKGMNDALVISTCKLIAAGYAEKGRQSHCSFILVSETTTFLYWTPTRDVSNLLSRHSRQYRSCCYTPRIHIRKRPDISQLSTTMYTWTSGKSSQWCPDVVKRQSCVKLLSSRRCRKFSGVLMGTYKRRLIGWRTFKAEKLWTRFLSTWCKRMI